ncbi:MAG: hypothetical protein UHD09_09655 [Bifidobacterium sp.]|nr:hypothetical protein [Bifidobacterium sp.]
MVDYDQAVAIIKDPNADPIDLAKVAYENPEFGANVAAHHRAYPGLLRWIAQFGDERARQTAAQLGYEAEDGPVDERLMEEIVTGEQGRPVAVEPQQAAAAGAQWTAMGAQGAQPVHNQPVSDVDMLHEEFANAYEGGEPSYEQPRPTVEPAYGQQAAAGATYYTQPEPGAAEAYGQAHYAQATQAMAPVNAPRTVASHGFTAQQAATTTDPAVMQRIAQYAPELHPSLATNPYLYPELREWLAQVGDAATQEALRQSER